MISHQIFAGFTSYEFSSNLDLHVQVLAETVSSFLSFIDSKNIVILSVADFNAESLSSFREMKYKHSGPTAAVGCNLTYAVGFQASDLTYAQQQKENIGTQLQQAIDSGEFGKNL